MPSESPIQIGEPRELYNLKEDLDAREPAKVEHLIKADQNYPKSEGVLLDSEKEALTY